MQAWRAHAAPAGKRGRENARSRQSRAASASGRAPDRPIAALATDERRARGVTFSEPAINGNTTPLAEIQCQKVGDTKRVRSKINPDHSALKSTFLLAQFYYERPQIS